VAGGDDFRLPRQYADSSASSFASGVGFFGVDDWQHQLPVRTAASPNQSPWWSRRSPNAGDSPRGLSPVAGDGFDQFVLPPIPAEGIDVSSMESFVDTFEFPVEDTS